MKPSKHLKSAPDLSLLAGAGAAFALFLMLTSPACAQEYAARTGIFHNLGKAFNDAFFEGPGTQKRGTLTPIQRDFYAQRVDQYHRAPKPTQFDVLTSNVCSVFFHFDTPRPRLRPGHIYAEGYYPPR